jgi:hypothetical protein
MDAVTVLQPISPVKDFLAKSQKLLIDGKRVDAISGETFEVLYPSTNTVLTSVPKGEREDINRALEAARNAFENESWRKLYASEKFHYSTPSLRVTSAAIQLLDQKS